MLGGEWMGQAFMQRMGIGLAFLWANSWVEAQVSYLHPDHLNSTVIATNQNGDVQQIDCYTPFGESLTPHPNPLPKGEREKGEGVAYLFTGQELDAASELSYFNARYYDANLSRFLSVDPIFSGGNPHDPQQRNGYAYARYNPSKFVDPTGEAIWIPIAIAGGIILLGYLESGEKGAAGGAVDASPVIGDVKGLAEVFTGKDLITGDDLGNFRYLGIVGASEFRGPLRALLKPLVDVLQRKTAMLSLMTAMPQLRELTPKEVQDALSLHGVDPNGVLAYARYFEENGVSGIQSSNFRYQRGLGRVVETAEGQGPPLFLQVRDVDGKPLLVTLSGHHRSGGWDLVMSLAEEGSEPLLPAKVYTPLFGNPGPAILPRLSGQTIGQTTAPLKEQAAHVLQE